MGKKQYKKDVKNFRRENIRKMTIALKLATTKEEKEMIKKNLRLANWVADLTEEEAGFVQDISAQQTRITMQGYCNASRLILENYLLQHNLNIDLKEFENYIDLEGLKVQEFFREGKDYFMKLKEESKNIIADYEKFKKEGLKEKEINERLWLKYPKYSKNAIKNVILKHTATNCESTDCPLSKDDGNCGNEVVLSGKADCHNYVPSGTHKIDNIKTTKIEPKHNKKDEIFEFLEKNKELPKDQLKEMVVKKFNITGAGFNNYYWKWNNRKPITENKVKEVVKDMEMQGAINKGTSLKEISKTVTINAEVQGEAGTYQVINNTVSVDDGIPFKNREEVKESTAKEIKELQKKMDRINDICSEMLAVFDMYNL